MYHVKAHLTTHSPTHLLTHHSLTYSHPTPIPGRPPARSLCHAMVQQLAEHPGRLGEGAGLQGPAVGGAARTRISSGGIHCISR
jgi:hypothetical protein